MKPTKIIWAMLMALAVGAVTGPATAQDLVYSYQLVPTLGAFDFESFVIDGETYLACANHWNGSTNNLYSKIYQWQGDQFKEIQAVFTSGASYWESFFIDGGLFLAVANHYNGSYAINSEIFRKETPEACAGEDRMVFETVNLDGSESRDLGEGQIVAWDWALVHRTDPNHNRLAAGEMVSVENLETGFYTVTLMVTDDDGFTDQDDFTLAAFGMKGDFNLDGDVEGEDLSEFNHNFGR